MSVELEPEVIAEIQNDRKVNAIKKLRELRGIGLKESKELVDLYCSYDHKPVSSSGKVNSGNGLLLLIVFGVVCYLAYENFS